MRGCYFGESIIHSNLNSLPNCLSYVIYIYTSVFIANYTWQYFLPFNYILSKFASSKKFKSSFFFLEKGNSLSLENRRFPPRKTIFPLRRAYPSAKGDRWRRRKRMRWRVHRGWFSFCELNMICRTNEHVG